MGDIADDMFLGFRCSCCGIIIDGEQTGYERYCKICKENSE